MKFGLNLTNGLDTDQVTLALTYCDEFQQSHEVYGV